MKSLLLSLTLFVSSFMMSQTLTSHLKIALKTDNAKTFAKLLNDENLNACYEAGNSSYTLLALVIKTDAKNCFKVLLEKKVDLEKACSSKTPLMYTVKYGNLEMAEVLIKAGANPKAENNQGRTALDYAKKYEQKKLEMYLESL